ncbi:hypothetical protein chiPu_0019391 [Chiloscyllium punctatum]|uniref:Uncharacterized protein n=1 Tax=Chiloscyllium punctatum TaxID=137246 RepID=A0A401RRQ8_CHIPU|nr:hypothetical protein [Chiloscyllium punctatum]
MVQSGDWAPCSLETRPGVAWRLYSVRPGHRDRCSLKSGAVCGLGPKRLGDWAHAQFRGKTGPSVAWKRVSLQSRD